MLEEVGLETIVPGDRLLIRQGDVVPVDGTVASGVAILDQSALTGEPIPVQQRAGAEVMSGSTNAGEAFDLIASHHAAESTYAGIVRLVEEAQRSKAPMSRLADRFAMIFLGVTVLIAGVAWYLTGDPIRAVAVLVVATPCPLILAVPVAIVSGLSRAARFGILIKGGKAIEALGRVYSLVIDKTGTLTDGRARVVSVNIRGEARSRRHLAYCSLARSGVEAHHCPNPCDRGARPQAATLDPFQCDRDGGRGHRGQPLTGWLWWSAASTLSDPN